MAAAVEFWTKSLRAQRQIELKTDVEAPSGDADAGQGVRKPELVAQQDHLTRFEPGLGLQTAREQAKTIQNHAIFIDSPTESR